MGVTRFRLPDWLPLPTLRARLGQRIRSLVPGLRVDYGPMNGQPGRQQVVRDLLRDVPVQAILETGTYLGTTAKFLADASNVPVHSVEANQRFHRYAVERHTGDDRIQITLADSRVGLAAWAADPEVPKECVLFYLDAHWHRDLPLADELRLIADGWSDSLVLIDDFEVPGDPGYGFDDYGPGKRLCLDYIPAELRDAWVPLFPTMTSADEGGRKRGWVLLVPSARAETLVRSLSLIRSDWP